MLTLNDALRCARVEPKDVAVIFHTPKQPALARALRWMPVERPEVFLTYQAFHSPSVEPTLAARGHAVAFVGLADGRQVFAGLFKLNCVRDRLLDEVDADPAVRVLHEEFGDEPATKVSRDAGIGTRRHFEFETCLSCGEYLGRLVVAKPSGRRYVRLAEKLDAPIVEISRASLLAPDPPDWRSMIVSAAEVRSLPHAWADRLAQWRGVYLIVDRSDGARYVGSAYGGDNLLGRWREHVRRDRGVTAELLRRDPPNFRFSILERVNPDWEAADVVAVENGWKARLDTIVSGLNRA